jgi:SAM-dependent methyltransferase
VAKTEKPRACPICDSRSTRPLLEWEGFNSSPAWADVPDGMRLLIGKCADCGLVFATNSDEVDMSNTKFIHHRPSRDPVPTPSARLGYHRAQLDMLERYLPEKAQVLDYGAGYCNFLRAARERGYKVEGICPIIHAVEWAERVLDIKLHPVFGVDYETDTRYDLIVSDMTFEHLVHPRDDLAKIRELLADNGVVYIEVPNWHTFKRLRHGVACLKDPMHYNYFTPNTLADMAKRAGFRVLQKAPAVDSRPARRLVKSVVNGLGFGTCSVVLAR